jgi:hypothetical protein
LKIFYLLLRPQTEKYHGEGLSNNRKKNNQRKQRFSREQQNQA